MFMFKIYKITNIINKKIYIGKTSKLLENRFSQHLKNKNKPKEQSRYLYRAMNKYGESNFFIELLEQTNTLVKANNREQFWIKTLKCTNPYGYNMTKGGDGGDTSQTPNYIQGMKLRRSYAGKNNPMYGKRGKNNPNYGKKRTAKQKEHLQKQLRKSWEQNETRRMMLSQKMKGQGNHMYRKKPANALFVELDGKRYDSMQDAIRFSKKPISYIKKNRKILGRKDGKRVK